MADFPKKPDQTANQDGQGGEKHGGEIPIERARRKILRSLVFTGGVGAGSSLIPATWTRPVVEAVTLPAHAQTTGPGFNGTGPVEFIDGRNEDGGSFEDFVQSVRQAVVNDAHAGGAQALIIPIGFCVNIVVVNLNDPNSPTTVTVLSNFFNTDIGTGTLNQLRTVGIVTGEGYTVIAEPLPGGGGSGTISGFFFLMVPGPCSPTDIGGESAG